MASTKPFLFSLHIGINQYPPNSSVSSLSGCVNDAKALQAFLAKHFAKDYKVKSALLFDEAATYDNIIAHFGEKHLGQAGKGDLVFFTYSGHGAKEKSAPEFKDPGGRGETLVCYDSRPNGKDLADKELAVLAKRLEEKGAYLVTLLDCCHSGSGFRSDEKVLGKARQCYDRLDERPLEQYLGGYFAKMKKTGDPIVVPTTNLLNLAACDRSEKAYEHGTHGLFTYCLLNVLNDSPRISYAKLFERTRQKMMAIADKQHPRFEPTGFFDSFEVFLRPGDTAEDIRNDLNKKNGKWYVNLGSLHGIPVTGAAPATFAIFKKGENTPFAHAQAVKVKFQETEINFEGGGEWGGEAKLISLPEPAIEVYMDEKFAKKYDNILKTNPATKPVFAALSSDFAEQKYSIEYVPGKIEIKNRSNNQLVKGFKTGKPADQENHLFKTAFDCLDQIAQWERVLALEKSSKPLQSDDFGFELVTKDLDGKEVTASNMATVEIFGQDGVFAEKPAFSLRLDNPTKNDLHFSIFYIQTDYSIMPLVSEIMPGKTVKDVYIGKLQLDDHEYEYLFHLKLVVSTEKIEDQLVQMKAMEGLGTIVNIDTKGGIVMDDNERSVLDDWFTKSLAVRIVGIDQELNDAKTIALEGGAIKILPNKKIKAKVNATSTTRGGFRSADVLNVLPRLFDEDSTAFFSTTANTRSTSSGPLVLNLEGLTGTEHIKENPLEIELSQSLADNEMLVPVTFDGDQIVVLGGSENMGAGKVKVTVDTMPDQQPPAATRSPGKALWLYFLKIIKMDTQYLRIAERNGEKVSRTDDGIFTKVKNAKRIVMVIHGIIGDTKEMAKVALKARDEGQYDLVLTFDYENLNTTIQETAAALEKKLGEAGIEPGCGKDFTILAHSMGGLVSRYYIENLSGKEVVKNLILAGTPNLGSNFGKIPEYLGWANKILGLASTVNLTVPYAASIIAFLKGAEQVTVTLAQMNYKDKGNFLKDLERNPDPGVPYHLVSGNIGTCISTYGKDNLSDKLFDMVAKIFNGQTDNDIAVLTSSIKGVDMQRSPAPAVFDVPCHHLNYFENEESSTVLLQCLAST
ncbi:MAG: caspase family protein [Lewinellaceae bacterium]|nr:caspase family protein [Saprospiraceae bacterium]MCB9336542.1 caspase family protein [Lewinellaceae bacterium]